MIFEEGSYGAEAEEEEEAAQWRHDNGNTKTTGTTGRVVDRDGRVGAVWRASFLLYERLNNLLEEAGFDAFVEERRRKGTVSARFQFVPMMLSRGIRK